ncbi:hypothetical protein [Burkholderia guangdongensis]|uniref:hypothetical protein n=1 Tax=Burkholderia guangdongensis TaxID=1792500 RepID=UPI0015CE46F0|nr:hypothetical protein [Burkholderia guangdongensis]
MVKTEIEQLEKALNVLVYRPKLVRRDYWVSQIERLLEQTGLSSQDLRRLHALRDLLGFPAGEYTVVKP